APYSKTDPRFFLEACKRYGVNTGEVLAVDDAYNAIKTCKDIGIRTLAVFEKHNISMWKMTCDTADYHIDSFDEWDGLKEEMLR
ncbi:MAG: HAD-IA family hydrolase, partial [Erysipelotrichaceae bacterium]|nr:HAD-IA family hydrolase [Erysipelotrichaceae bacterium]